MMFTDFIQKLHPVHPAAFQPDVEHDHAGLAGAQSR